MRRSLETTCQQARRRHIRLRRLQWGSRGALRALCLDLICRIRFISRCRAPAASPAILWPWGCAAEERGFCLLQGIAEGTYNSKHAEAARLYYTTTTTTTTTHMHTHTHLQSFKLGQEASAFVAAALVAAAALQCRWCRLPSAASKSCPPWRPGTPVIVCNRQPARARGGQRAAFRRF